MTGRPHRKPVLPAGTARPRRSTRFPDRAAACSPGHHGRARRVRTTVFPALRPPCWGTAARSGGRVRDRGRALARRCNDPATAGLGSLPAGVTFSGAAPSCLTTGIRRGKEIRGAWRPGHPDEAVPAEPGGPLVVAVRPGRGLLVRGDRDHRRLPAVLLQAEHVAGQLPRLVPQAGRRPDEPGVPVDAGHQFRRARRAADAADAPLGGAAVHRGGVRAPAAALLHRRVPQAALAELADLGDAAGAGHGGGPVRHHPPGRHAVRRQPRRAPGRHAVGPGHRHAPDVVDLRRGLPRSRDHPAGLLAARGGAADRDDRAAGPAAPGATGP